MDINTLTSIGLSPNEAKIYQTLIELKEAATGKIADHAGVHRRNVYDAIQRLLDKGLVFQVLPKKVLTYAPVHPDKLGELAEEQLAGFRKTLPDLVSMYERRVPGQSIFVYRGIGGLKNYINLEIKVGKPIYGIGSKGSWFDPRLKSFTAKSGKTFREKGIKSKLIYDREITKHPEVPSAIGQEYKLLPKNFSTESSIEIFGDYVAIYSGIGIKSFKNNITIFILKDRTLAQDYRKWFDLLWSLLPRPEKNSVKTKD